MPSVQSPDVQPYAAFLEALPGAPNETAVRELFVILAATAFGDQDFATTLALGAEYAVAFSHRGLVRRGRIDSFIDNVLVEFKTSLASQADRDAARDQLAGYIAGAWAEDANYRRPYLAVATDGLTWYVYSARPIDATVPAVDRIVQNVRLTLTESWPQPSSQPEPGSLRRFLNRTFFRQTLLPPTSENFARDFGLGGPVFITVCDTLARKADELAGTPQMQLYQASWFADLQVAYGHVDDTGDLFIRHTYLAVLARLLVWATLERRAAEPEDLRRIFDRTYFIGKRIGNLVEDDYFAWHLLPAGTDINPAWMALVAQLATYQLDAVAEDVLKPLYEALVDPVMRHDLGEYYTPDWLATAIVDRIVENWDPDSRGIPRMLDPACGSGSFLRAAVHRLRAHQDANAPGAKRLEEVLANVHGMDVHPLAAIIAKATYLLAIADLIPAAREVVSIPVYLCNSLSGETLGHAMSLLGEMVKLEVGRDANRREFEVPEEFVTDGALYDRAIGEVVNQARSIGSSRTAARHAYEAVRYRLRDTLSSVPQHEVLLESLAQMGVHIAQLVKLGEDSIYGFLLRNRYRSILLRGHFDLVVGNPPWLTLADISAGGYRDLVLTRNEELRIAPRGAGEQAHTEIATIFLAQVAKQFLKYHKDSEQLLRLGFVLPRSVFSATHHRFLRTGSYKPLIDVAELWDLERVDPLFNIPACVLFLAIRQPSPMHTKPGRVYAGRLRVRDPDVATAMETLQVAETEFALRHLGRRTAWGVEVAAVRTGGEPMPAASARLEALLRSRRLPPQPYVQSFRQGAILYPQVLLTVDQVGGTEPITRGPVTVRTSEASAATAKLLRDLRLQRVVDAESLFFTVAADHLLPFTLRNVPWTVILPVTVPPSDPEFAPVEPDTLRARGFALTADWLDEAESYWESVRKPRERTPLWDRLDYLGQLSAQAGRARYLILFPSSPGLRMAAALIDTKHLARPFVVRDKVYWASTDDIAEAHYLLAFLNSGYADAVVSDFVTRGLLGKRDTHKRLLDIPWPRWNPLNDKHVQLASLGAAAVAKADGLLPHLIPQLGRARSQLRHELESELSAIDRLVATISVESVS